MSLLMVEVEGYVSVVKSEVVELMRCELMGYECWLICVANGFRVARFGARLRCSATQWHLPS